MYRFANQYAALGWSVVPVAPARKCPAISWRLYQQRRPTADELIHWFAGRDDVGIGIVTGRISDLVVLDVDPGHGGQISLRNLGIQPETATVETGGGGFHHYYLYPDTPGGVPSCTGLLPGLDLRADGGFVVCPPTIHPVTHWPYGWLGLNPRRPEVLPPAALMQLVREQQQPTDSPPTPTGRCFNRVWRSPVGEGERNAATARLAGALVRAGLGDEKAGEILRVWNAENRPPLPEKELLAVYRSIKRTHEQRNR